MEYFVVSAQARQISVSIEKSGDIMRHPGAW
jgi:hypothetical protein